MKEKYWVGDVSKVDDFGHPILDEFIDGATRLGPWAIMAPKTWQRHGYGRLGMGRGQRYKKQPDGRWLKVGG